MKTIALLFLTLIVSSNAVSIFEKYPMKFGGSRSFMTLLTQIEETMKNGGPLEAVNKKLDDFQREITEEQRSHDNLWGEQQQSCTEELNYRLNEVATAKNTIQEGQGALSSCTSQKNTADSDLSITTDQLISNTNGLSEITRQRAREKYAYDTLANVWDLTQQAVAGAISILQDIWNGQKQQGAFVEITAHVNQILQHSLKMGGKLHGLGQLMQTLAQLKTKDLQADEALFEQIKTMLNNFKDKKQQEFLDASTVEQNSISEFQANQQRYQTVLDHLNQQKIDLESEVKQLNKCIVVQTGVVNSATAKRDRNQELYDNANGLCSACADEYQSSTAKRKEELQLLSQIRERVQARFSQLSDGVKDRANQDEFSYTNQYTGLAQTEEKEEDQSDQ